MSIDWVPIIVYAVIVVAGVIPMRLAGLRREMGMFVALVTICLGLFLSNPDFLGQSNVLNASKQISMLGIYAIGIGFVIITGGIDLSIGSIVGLTGVLMAATVNDGLGWFSQPTVAVATLVLVLGLIAAIASGLRWLRLGTVAGIVLIVAHNAVRHLLSGFFDVGALPGTQPLWVGIVVAITWVLLIGVIQGSLITSLDLQSFIVTLGGMLLLRGVSQTIVRGGTLSFGNSTFRDFANSGIVSPPAVMRHFALTDVLSNSGFQYALKNTLAVLTAYPTLVFLVTAVVAGFVLHFTVFGRYVYAIGGNRDAAEYSGIPVKRVETLTYVISAGLAGVAGICYASYIGQMSQQVGIAYELYAIAAAVLGGCSLRGGEGTVIGIIIGSAIMRVIDNGINMFQFLYRDARGFRRIWRLDQNWTFIIIGGVILVAVILDQVVHIVQARRRTRRAGASAGSGGTPPSPPGLEPVPVAAPAGAEAERIGAEPQAGVRESHV
jgi:ribose transport system permease protein